MSQLFKFSLSFPPPFSAFNIGTGHGNNSDAAGSKPDRPGSARFMRKRPRGISSQNPSTTSEEKGNADDNSTKTRHHDEEPETTKTMFTTLSALTGVVPCHFEGSTYVSKLSTPTCCATEDSTNKEMPDKSEPKPPSTQIVTVSRILKGIHQNPHFLPIKAYISVAKQMLMNAWDNIFEDTVDKLLSLQINGFYSDAKRLWQTMEDLQKMGYDVLLLRRRLVELTDVFLSQMRHRREIKRLKSEADQRRMEKSRLEFEIVKLRAQVEAENASVENVMSKVAKMEDETPHFKSLFTKLNIQLF